MNYKKFLFFILLFLQISQHNAIQATHDKSIPVTKFIEQQEQYLADLKKIGNELCNRCTYTISQERGNYRYTTTHINPFASDQDIAKLYLTNKAVKSWPNNIDQAIAQYVADGQSLDAIDEHGKTALDYAESCYTYQSLRSQGASFQIIPCLYIHRYYAIPTAGALMFIVYKLYSAGYFSYNRYAHFIYRIKNNLTTSIEDLKKIIYTDYDESHEIEQYDPSCLSSQDKNGRTPLMNYLIKQEATLHQLRSTIKKMEGKLSDIDNYYTYYTALIEHQFLLKETQNTIKQMIKSNCNIINVRDNFGKSLTQYCYTQEIYNDLNTYGAPFEISSWLYFNKNYLTNDTKGFILMTLILSIVPTAMFIERQAITPKLNISL